MGFSTVGPSLGLRDSQRKHDKIQLAQWLWVIRSWTLLRPLFGLTLGLVRLWSVLLIYSLVNGYIR